MSEVDDLFEASTARQDRKPQRKHPTGYEPGFMLDANREGYLVPAPRRFVEGETIATDREPWDAHLRKAGLDPAKVQVVPPVEVRTWDAAIGNGEVQTMVYFKAKIVGRVESWIDAELAKWVLKWKPTKSEPIEPNDRSLVVAWSDWQIGKGEADGTRGTVDRVVDSFDQTVDRYHALKKQGVTISQIVVVPLGDILEGVCGFYPQQTFTVDLNLRYQCRLSTRLMVQGLKTLSDLAPLVVPVVGGNHGEVRQAGKSFTDFADNLDVMVVEYAADVLAENRERFGHVTFHIPRDELSQTLDLHGTVMGIAHGHQARGGGKPEGKLERWWDNQRKGQQPIGDADLLLTGHFHHLMLQNFGTRWHFGAPTLDAGSKWFTDVSGADSPAGTLTFTVDKSGWDNLRVLPAVRS
jgi:hypothetical protein